MRFILIILIILLIGAFFIISNEHLSISKKENVKRFFNLYSNWLFNVFDNIKGLTANVINTRWLPKNNSSNQSNSSIIKIN